MGKQGSKNVGRDARSAPKERHAPAFESAKKTLEKLRQEAYDARLTPLQTRRRIAKARDVSKGPWRRAVHAVFGAGVLELPDFRQLSLFGGS